MSHAALTSLIETLNRLHRLLNLIIYTKNLQIEFCESRCIITDFLTNYLREINDCLYYCPGLNVRWHPNNIMRPGFVKKIHNEKTRRPRFRGESYYSDVRGCICFIPRILFTCGDSASLYATRKTWYFFCARAKTISALCDVLGLLRWFLWDSANKLSGDEKLKSLEGRTIELSYRTQDFIEGLLFDSSIQLKTMNFVNAVFNGDPVSLLGRINFEADIQDIFNKETGVYHCLKQTFEEIDLIWRDFIKIHIEKPVTENLQLEQVSDKGSQPAKDSSQHSPPAETEVVGLDDDLQSILDRLTASISGLKTVAIVGMGGIGKTTLAKRVLDNLSIRYHFHVSALVTVSQSYCVRDLLLELLKRIRKVTDEREKERNESPAEDIYRSLKGKRYLIVMDDLWDTKAWCDFKLCFPDDQNGSRIVVTTRLMEVADNVEPRTPPHHMSLLGVDDSWKLLNEKVFGKEGCPLELVDIGKKIARKCHGLPLAIVVVAGLLSRIRRTSDCWNGIADSVSSVVNAEPEQCMKILALSCNHLPPHQKACFLYMGAFPEDCEIEAHKLINLWMAEGFLDGIEQLKCIDDKFVQLTTSKPSTEEKLGEDYLEDLIARSLVLVGKRSFSGKIKTCRIHDLLRDLCLKEAQTERFMHVLKRDAKEIPADINNLRRFSFQSEFSSDFNLIPAMPLVRSFLCFSLGLGFSPDIMFFHLGFKLLRVLDITFLRFLRFENFPVQIIAMVHLRYLAFTATFELPASLSELRNLRILIIHGPWIYRGYSVVPSLLLEYWNMPWLRHLHTSVPCYLSNPFITEKDLRCPLAPKNLQNLSTMTFAICTKEVFAIMPCLRKLGICETEEDYSSDESSKSLSNLVYLSHLEELKCSFYKQTTKARKLIGSDTFPSSLRNLTLSWSYMPWESMSTIAMLPNLEVLKLKNYAFQGPEWEPSEGGFQRLKLLLIENTDLVHWEASSDHFPLLQYLVLRSCKLLEEIPFGVVEIPTLQLIELHYCSESAEISAKEIQDQIEGLDIDIRRNQ